MRSNTTIFNEVRGANRMTRNAATGKWMTGFARLGYAATRKDEQTCPCQLLYRMIPGQEHE